MLNSICSIKIFFGFFFFSMDILTIIFMVLREVEGVFFLDIGPNDAFFELIKLFFRFLLSFISMKIGINASA
jgi:hypothetical protein